MVRHDCSKCKASGNCPIEKIAPWLNEHEEEAEVAKAEVAHELAMVIAIYCKVMPFALADKESLIYAMTAVFWFGYHKGRTFLEVPEVFKG